MDNETYAADDGMLPIRVLLNRANCRPEPGRGSVTVNDVESICSLTLELTRLRQNECKHLCIENFAPELFGRLLKEFASAERADFECDLCGRSFLTAEVRGHHMECCERTEPNREVEL